MAGQGQGWGSNLAGSHGDDEAASVQLQIPKGLRTDWRGGSALDLQPACWREGPWRWCCSGLPGEEDRPQSLPGGTFAGLAVA